MLYICVSFWLLAHESRDLSQAETKMLFLKAEQSHKMTIFSLTMKIFFTGLVKTIIFVAA